jgi:hypothetical protein
VFYICVSRYHSESWMCFIFVSAAIIRNLECVLYLCQQISFGILDVFYICVRRYHSESWMCSICVSVDIIQNRGCVLYLCQQISFEILISDISKAYFWTRWTFEKFNDTKWVIRIHKSKKDKQHNCQKKKGERTNNDLQNIQIKLKI